MENVPVLQSLVDSLSGNIDVLEEKLGVVLDKDLVQIGTDSDAAKQAKLYVMLAYTLDSLLFGKSVDTLSNGIQH
jgi:hypothetical protein